MIVYISIGNSDDKLTQALWSAYVGNVGQAIMRAGKLHGEWASASDAMYQNACWCVELHPARAEHLKAKLSGLAIDFKQDSIAWAEAPKTEFIGGAP